MKSLTTYSLLFAASAQSALIPPQFDLPALHNGAKRQALGTLTWMMGKGGKVADPPGASPKRVEMKSPSTVAGVRRVKLRYGPYQVPNMQKTGLTGEAGSLWNYPDTAIPKPCSECTIVSQQAGLEFPNGQNANIDSGMWLHHMVHLAIGPGRQDATCFGRASLPHVDVGASPSNSERYFSSGNERTHVAIDKMGASTNYGYHLRSTDKFAFIVDLMNMNMEDKVVYLTMTYDIIEGPLPSGWRDVKPVWFDANQCGTSEVNAPKQSGQFVISSQPWRPNFEGEILGVGGHLHDGGQTLKVHVNNDMNCDSVAGYGETPEFISKAMMGAGKGYATKHISSMVACYFGDLKVRKLSKDQTWQIKGHYDYDRFQGNKNEKGMQESIMAIAIMFVAVTPGLQLGGGSAAPAPARGTAKGVAGMAAPKGAFAVEPIDYFARPRGAYAIDLPDSSE